MFLILDSNIIPIKDTFESMIYIYNHSFANIVSSVTPVFKWNGAYCYPTDKRWLRINSNSNIKTYSGIGKVIDVKEYDVPLLFSLWNTCALRSIIDDVSLPENHKLDIEINKLLLNKGYHNLRLMDKNVNHINNGLNSVNTRLSEIIKEDTYTKYVPIVQEILPQTIYINTIKSNVKIGIYKYIRENFK